MCVPTSFLGIYINLLFDLGLSRSDLLMVPLFLNPLV